MLKSWGVTKTCHHAKFSFKQIIFKLESTYLISEYVNKD